MASRLTRTNAVTVNDVLDWPKLLEVDCLDRVHLTMSVPNLVVGGQVVSFLNQHEGMPVPSPALLERRGQAFRRAVMSFAEANDIPVIGFTGKKEKTRPGVLADSPWPQRKIDQVMPLMRKAAATGRSQVVAIGVAQEYQRVFTGTRSATDTGAVWFTYQRVRKVGRSAPPAHAMDRPARAVVGGTNLMRPTSPASPSGYSKRLLTVLIAAGFALVVGLVGTLALGDEPDTRPVAEPVVAAPVDQPASVASGTSSGPGSSPPTKLTPVSPRQLAAELAAIVDNAESRNDIDPETADDLRDKLAGLNQGKPKDRTKRIQELRERVTEAAERGRISADTVTRLQDLLASYSQGRGEEEDD